MSYDTRKGFRIERKEIVTLWLPEFESGISGVRNQLPSRLNGHSQTNWAIEDWATKILNSTNPSLWWTTVKPTWCHSRKMVNEVTYLIGLIPWLLTTAKRKFQGIRRPVALTNFFQGRGQFQKRFFPFKKYVKCFRIGVITPPGDKEMIYIYRFKNG